MTLLECIDLWLLGEQWLIPQLKSSITGHLYRIEFSSVTKDVLKTASFRVFEHVEETRLQKIFVELMIAYSKQHSHKVRSFIYWFPLHMLQMFTAEQFDIVAKLEERYRMSRHLLGQRGIHPSGDSEESSQDNSINVSQEL